MDTQTQVPRTRTQLFIQPRLLTSLTLLGILAVLMWLRLFNILLLPIYYDEALHLGRAQQALAEHTVLIGTEGGKYLVIWLQALTLAFAQNDLLAARVLSSIIGLLAGIGCYLLARHLYERDDVALVAVVLYAISPFVLFFDRMAMADGLLSALGIWSCLLSLLVVRQQRWWQAAALGIILGMASATKLNGLLFLAFPLLAAWLWRDGRPLRRVLPTVLVAWVIAVLWLLPSLLDFAPQYHSIIERSWLESAEKDISLSTRLAHNLDAIGTTLWTYLTPPILILALAEALRALRQRDKASYFLALAALITPAFFFLTAGVDKFHTRYILPAFPLLLIMAARGILALVDWLCKHTSRLVSGLRIGLLAGIVLLCSMPALRFDYLLVTDPPRAPWISKDHSLYVTGPLAGYGVLDASAYLRGQADELGLIIVVKRTDNTKRTGAWAYYLNQPNVLLEAINLKYAEPQELIQALYDAPGPVFVVLDRPFEDVYAADFTDGPYALYSTLVATFPRPGDESRIEVYQVQPQP